MVIDIDSILGKINYDALELFDAIHEARGSSDDSAYEKKVCDLYERSIRECIKELKVDFCIVSIDKREQLDRAFKNITKIKDLIIAVEDAFERKADFRLFDGRITGKKGIGTEELGLWLDQAIIKISALPSSEMLYGTGYEKKPLMALKAEPEECTIEDAIIEKYNPYIYDFVNKGVDRSTGKLLTAIDKSKNPYKDAIIIDKTEAELKKIGIKAPMYGMLSIDDAIKVIIEELARVRAAARAIAMKEINKKRRSFWTNFVVWAAIMTAAVILTYVLKIRIVPAYQYNGNGFWANFGIILVYIIALIIIAALFIAMYEEVLSYDHESGLSRVFTWAPIFPRGLCTILCIYWLFVSDFAKEVGKYRIPFYVAGIGCLICIISFELYDVIGHKFTIYETFADKLDSPHRGTVMYSPLLTALPLGLLALYTKTFQFLHISSAWILGILLFAAVGVFAGYTIFGSIDETECYYMC